MDVVTRTRSRDREHVLAYCKAYCRSLLPFKWVSFTPIVGP
jgi:hypothetical protein